MDTVEVKFDALRYDAKAATFKFGFRGTDNWSLWVPSEYVSHINYDKGTARITEGAARMAGIEP